MECECYCSAIIPCRMYSRVELPVAITGVLEARAAVLDYYLGHLSTASDGVLDSGHQRPGRMERRGELLLQLGWTEGRALWHVVEGKDGA